jgi:pilus assembly protein Flp/PilA
LRRQYRWYTRGGIPCPREGQLFNVESITQLRRQDGQGLAEYALILALIAVIAIAAVTFLGGQISTILSSVGASI